MPSSIHILLCDRSCAIYVSAGLDWILCNISPLVHQSFHRNYFGNFPRIDNLESGCEA